MKRAVYPGSFDPATNGHIDIIRRSAKQVEQLIVAVLNNVNKQSLLSVEERVALLEQLTTDLPNVTIKSFSGLLIDFVALEKAEVIIRGFRAISDYEHEIQMAQMNHQLDPTIETLFLVTRNEYSFLSSSVVKEIAKFGGDVSGVVDPRTAIILNKKYSESEVLG